MVAESTPAEHQPRAYSYLSLTSQICVFLSPLIGGALYGYSTTWLPHSFTALPALVPSMVNGAFVMGACIAVVLCVNEVSAGV